MPLDNTPPSTLTIALLASNGGTTIDLGQSNQLCLQLTNNTGAAITLPGGAPGDPPGTAFTLNVILSALYGTTGSPADVTISLAGWTATYFPNADFPAWAISPDADVVFDDGASLTISIDGLTPTAEAGSYKVPIDVYNLPGTSSSAFYPVIGVQSAATGKNLHDVLSVSLDVQEVATSRMAADLVTSSLVLTLANADQKNPLVPPGTPWSAQPKFIISFIYAGDTPGYNALTTPALAQSNITVGPGTNTTGWNANQVDGPYWELAPQSGSNHQILGTGLEAVATFNVDDIVTLFAPGATLFCLQCINVPDYADTWFVVPLTKYYEAMSITGPLQLDRKSYTVGPNAPADAFLSWTVANAALVEVTGLGQVAFENSGQTKVEVDRTTNYVLTAYDPFLQQILTSTATATANAPGSSSAAPVSALLGQGLPTGTILLWAGAQSSIPAGYALCDGATLTIAQYPALYQVIGTTYGGDATTFDLPSLNDRFVLGAAGAETPGASGSSTHSHGLSTLTVGSQTSVQPSHQHAVPSSWYARNLTSGGHTGIDTDGDFSTGDLTQSSGQHFHNVTPSFTNSTLNPVDGSQVRPPWFGLCHIIRTS